MANLPYPGRSQPRTRSAGAGVPVGRTGGAITGDLQDAERRLLERFGGSLPAAPENLDAMREADRRLVELLGAEGFAGPVFERRYTKMIGDLTGYAWPVLLGWITKGEIFALCRKAGRPVLLVEQRQLTADDRMELASEAVLAGETLFLEVGLRRGHWNPDGGLSLRAYFVNACVREFARVYGRWQKGRREAEQLLLPGDWDFDDHLVADLRPGPEELAVLRDLVSEAVKPLEDPQLRQVLFHRMNGHTERDAAERAGLRPKQAERRLARYRTQIKAAASQAPPGSRSEYGRESG